MTRHWRYTVKFQKALAVFAGTSNAHEAEAAELAARRLMAVYDIDPVAFPDVSFYSQMNFADNTLLKKLREEWRAAHPTYYYGVLSSSGARQRLKRKPRPRKPKPVDINQFNGLFADVFNGEQPLCAERGLKARRKANSEPET